MRCVRKSGSWIDALLEQVPWNRYLHVLQRRALQTSFLSLILWEGDFRDGGEVRFNRKAWKLVEKWARLHEEELMEAWEARSRHDPLPEINPLP